MRDRRFAFVLTASFLAGLTACGPAARSHDEITVMQTEAPRSMDPANETATYTTAVLDPMYQGLTGFNEQLQIVPVLATELHSNAEGTRWKAHLRSGVLFHDGTRFDVQSAVLSFRRLLSLERGLAASGLFRSLVRDVAACGDSDVCFSLKSPYAAFPSLLTIYPIVSPTADRRGELDQHAVGTGPYRFVRWNTGESVLEERNPTYWGSPAPFKRIRWLWSTESALMNMALVAREVDLVNPLPPVFAEALSHSKRVRLVQGKSLAVFWMALNVKSKPLDDIRVRRALNYATDRNAIIRSQLRGYGVSANSPLAPADFAYAPETQGYAYDPQKARSLLTQAGYPHGFTLNVVAQEGQVNIMQALAGMWAQVNVTLQIQQMESGVYAQTIFGNPQQKQRQNVQAVFASWAASSLDPDQQLSPLYRTISWSPQGANLGFYSNPALDILLDRARAELDGTKRKALYALAQQMITDDAPHVLLYYSTDLAAEGRSLLGPWIFPGGQVRLQP